MAQVGEFSFLLAAAAGLPLGLFRAGDYQFFLSAAVLSMVATPAMIQLARPFAQRVAARSGLARRRGGGAPEADSLVERAGHTVVVGYGLAGRYLARVLQAAGIACVVVEQNPELVARAREDGIAVVFGDGTQHAVLEHVRLRKARVIVFAISSATDERRGVALAREINPAVRIVVRTRYILAIDELRKLGANDVVVEEFEASLELFALALGSLRDSDQPHLARGRRRCGPSTTRCCAARRDPICGSIRCSTSASTTAAGAGRGGGRGAGRRRQRHDAGAGRRRTGRGAGGGGPRRPADLYRRERGLPLPDGRHRRAGRAIRTCLSRALALFRAAGGAPREPRRSDLLLDWRLR